MYVDSALQTQLKCYISITTEDIRQMGIV